MGLFVDYYGNMADDELMIRFRVLPLLMVVHVLDSLACRVLLLLPCSHACRPENGSTTQAA